MYKDLLQTAKPLLQHKRQLAVALLALAIMSICFGAGLGLLLPIFNFLLNEEKTLGQLADDALNGPLESTGNWIAANAPQDPFYGFMLVMSTILVLTLISGFARFVQTVVLARVMMRVIQWWRLRLYRAMLQMDMATYWDFGSADGTSRIMNDVEGLKSGFHSILIRTVQSAIKVIIALGVAFIINWQLTLLALVGGPFIALLMRKFGKSIRKASKHTLVASADMLHRMNESLGDLRVVRMSQSEAIESRRFFESSQRMYREQVRRYRIRALSSCVVEFIAMVGVILVAGFSAWNIFRLGVPGSEFMTILGALVAAGSSFKPISNLHHVLTAADAAATRIIEMDRRLQENAQPPRGDLPKLPRHAQSISFENLSYTYPKADTQALTDINLDIRFGQFIAIVGGNGSGKTTLVAALTRLITPEAGRILIDDRDIAEHDLKSVRDQMAMVTQKTKLFKGTIAYNIAYGRSWTSPEQIAQAAKIATADRFIDEMPQGYDTPIGEGGEGVSGGQAQRICIARAVLRDPAILILDEATSQVDTQSEALIAKAMDRITEGRTTIVIAHRMSTVVNADKIVVMDQGRIVSEGTHEDLMQRCPFYQALAKGQLQAGESTLG